MGTKKFIADEGIQVDNVQIGVSGTGEIDTSTGNLTIDSAGGTVTIDDNLTVTGDFTVSGSVTTINTETLTVNDNLIVLNNNVTGSPTENAGVEVERGTSANVAIRWNETSDKWEITEDGTTYYDIATESYVDAQSIAALDDIGDVSIVSASAGEFLKWNGTAWINDTIDLGTDTTGNYLVDIAAGTGITVTHTPGEGSSASVALNAALNDLTDVSAASPSNGEFLKYVSASSAWVPAAIPTINALDDIGDVSASAPTTGHFLKWDGSAWVPAAATTAATTTTVSSNSETQIYSFLPSSYGTAELLIQTTQGSKRTVTKGIVAHDGSDGDYAELVAMEFGSPVIPLTVSGVLQLNGNRWVTQTSNFGNTAIQSVAFGNNLWVAGGLGGQLRTSTDAVTWVTRTSNFINSFFGNINTVAYGDGLWVAGGYSGGLRTSTDAITWVTQTSQFGTTRIDSIAYGNSLWVAVGRTGQIRSSTDAVTWVTRTSNFGNTDIYSVSYGNNLWVAGGRYGQLRTSTDAVTWTTRTSNFSGNVNEFAYANNIWVAVGGYGNIRTSTDAVTWVTRTSNFGNAGVYSVAFGNNLWVAGGLNGQIRASTDAITWVTKTSNLQANYLGSLYTIAYGNSMWVAGGYGSILTSYGQSPLFSVFATITDAATTSATVKVLPTSVEA